MPMDPEVARLLSNLAEITLRNSAAAITTRVQAIRTGRKHEEALNELESMINELVADREQLVGIAQGLEAALGAQRISAEEIDYIVEKIIPTLEKLVDDNGDSSDGGEDDTGDSSDGGHAEGADAKKYLESLKAVLSVDTLTVLQLIGFNYKAAIGEPLTALVRHAISGRVSVSASEPIESLVVRRELALFELAKDPEAFDRLRLLSGN